MSAVKKLFIYNRGSTLILLLLTVTITTVLGISLLIVSMMNFKIMKNNSDARKAFYLAEAGLNNAYADVYELIIESIEDSKEKALDYLELYPTDESEAENIFINSYKVYISSNIISRVAKYSNPGVQIVEEESVAFIEDKLNVSVLSKYKGNGGIIKIARVNLVITIPDFDDIIVGSIDISVLITPENWVLSTK